MAQMTPLYEHHVAAGAKLTDFAGWSMPLHYGSQINEHHAVRREAGLFDVSHMCPVDIEGDGAREFLRFLLANDIAKIEPARALYSCMLNERGGVIDDLIVYGRDETAFRAVVNAGTANKDVAWIEKQAEAFNVQVRPRRDLGILAVQGPQARELAAPHLPAGVMDLKPFGALVDGDTLIGRTGYTGEDGFECIVPATELVGLWERLTAAGAKPCGLGARDTLRLEAGLNLYGQDMDEDTSPLAAGLAWTVAFEPTERDFIGRAALEAERAAGPPPRFVGLLLAGRGVMRAHQRVFTAAGEGLLTSGGFSPTLNCSIGLARLPAGDDAEVEVEIRGKRLPARVVKPPFVRKGKILINLEDDSA